MNRQLFKNLDAYRFVYFASAILLAFSLLTISTWNGADQIESIHLRDIAVNNTANERINFVSKLDSSNLAKIQSYEISFKGKVLESNYGNFFQTDDGQRAIRLELNKPNDLSLIFFDSSEGIYKVTENFSLDEWHDIRLIGQRSNYIKLFIDSELAFYATTEFTKIYRGENILTLPPNITALEINEDFGNFAVGTGFTRERDLVGEIKDFNLRIEFIPKWNHWNILAVIVMLFVMVTQTFLTLRKLKQQNKIDISSSINKSLRLTAFILLILFVGNWIASIGTDFHKWLPFLMIGLTTLAFPYLQILGSRNNLKFKNIYTVLEVLALFLLLIFIYGSLKRHFSLLGVYSSFFIGGVICIVSTYLVTLTNSNGYLKNWKLFLSIIVLSLASWAALFDLPNWLSWSESIQKNGPYAFVISLIVFIALVEVLFYSRSSKKINYATKPFWFFTAFICIIFSFLSFRYDSLFMGSSEYHWEYFVGPIRGLRDGGWLLWDTPSQYGFLNILLASLLPLKNSWQALYVFQGCLLLLVAILYYLTICKYLTKNYILNFFLVTLTLFFADPLFIGPQFYPSSSVFRFIWCYLLFLLIINFEGFHLKSRRNLYLFLCMWIFGCLWSFESAVYSSAIFFLGAVAYVFSLRKLTSYRDLINQSFILLRIISFALICLSATLIVISGYYKINLGVLPDFKMFYEYALNYGGGFGGIPIQKFGAIWVYVLLFCGLYGAIFFVRLDAIEIKNHNTIIFASLGIVLSLTTYLIGRAHASNITAVLPIICFVVIVVLLINQESSHPNIPLYAIGFPVIFISLCGGLAQPSSIDHLTRIASFTGDIQNRLRPPDPTLEELIKEAKITPHDSVAYYGFHAAMPIYLDGENVKAYEKTWIFNPFQLLEEPISYQRRQEIAMRSLVDRGQNEGYIVQAKGQFEERFNEWMGIISKYYLFDKTYENKDFRIIHLIKN